MVIRSKTKTSVVKISDIYYAEIFLHTVVYHTALGELTATGTMKKVCEAFKEFPFSLCSQSHLVNLKYVTHVSGNEVAVADTKLSISRLRKKEFMHDLNKYLAVTGRREIK